MISIVLIGCCPAKQAELESELQSAADFVRAQLPLPGIPAPGVSMQWAYQPSLALGGDLFQVSAWGSETLGLYILDASGHGVAAALRAVALMSFYVRTISRKPSAVSIRGLSSRKRTVGFR